MTQEPAIEVLAGAPDVPAKAVDSVRRILPDSLRRIRLSFPEAPNRPFRVVLHRTPDSIPEPVRAALHPGTPGVAALRRDEIHLVLSEIRAGSPNDLRTVLDHELVHVLLDHHVGAAAPHVPRWLHEGLAQVLSGDTYLGAREEQLVYPAYMGHLLPFRDLRDDFPDDASDRQRAYAQSFSFVDYLGREIGLRRVIELAGRCGPEGGFERAYARATGESLLVHHDGWRDYLLNRSGASWRWMFQNCFAYVMILGFVLLALAGIRRWNRDLIFRRKLEREDELADDDGP